VRDDEVALEWGLDSAVRGDERREDVVGPGSDPGVDVGRDPLDQRRALDLGGDEGVNGWSPVGADLGAGCGEV